jgi:hypothetical protein
MKNPWFRLYGEFSSDPKVQSMSETFQRRLVMLFCLRCRDDLPGLTEEEIRFALHISPSEFSKTKNLFVEKGFIRSDFTIINWDKRQFISDDVSQRVQRHRDKVKRYRNVTETEMKRPCNENETAPDTDTDTDTDTDRKNLLSQPPTNGGAPESIIPSTTTSDLLGRYTESEQQRITEVFRCIATTRKTGRMAPSVELLELKYWDTFEKWKVIAGIETYLDKGLHSYGKAEKYLRGIIRNSTEQSIPKNMVVNKPSKEQEGKYAGITKTIDNTTL